MPKREFNQVRFCPRCGGNAEHLVVLDARVRLTECLQCSRFTAGPGTGKDPKKPPAKK